MFWIFELIKSFIASKPVAKIENNYFVAIVDDVFWRCVMSTHKKFDLKVSCPKKGVIKVEQNFRHSRGEIFWVDIYCVIHQFKEKKRRWFYEV